MLAGVLLHMIAAASDVDGTVDTSSPQRGDGSFEKVKNEAVVIFGDFDDVGARVRQSDRAGVKDLAAAGGIKSGAVEDERRTRIGDGVDDFGVEFVEKRIVIVEMVGHNSKSNYHQGHQGSQRNT